MDLRRGYRRFCAGHNCWLVILGLDWGFIIDFMGVHLSWDMLVGI